MQDLIVYGSNALAFCGGLYGLICHMRMRRAQQVEQMLEREIVYWKSHFHFPDHNAKDGSHI